MSSTLANMRVLFTVTSILILLYLKDTMCGTFTQLFAQALAIGVIDNVFTPNYQTSEFGMIIDVVLKGIATFWLYKWGQCTNGVRSPNTSPFANYNAMAILVGGLIGAVTLFAVGQIMGDNPFGKDRFIIYFVDAIAVHLVYGVSGSIVQNFT